MERPAAVACRFANAVRSPIHPEVCPFLVSATGRASTTYLCRHDLIKALMTTCSLCKQEMQTAAEYVDNDALGFTLILLYNVLLLLGIAYLLRKGGIWKSPSSTAAESKGNSCPAKRH